MKRVNLIWTKKEQLNIAEKTKWLNYKPTDVWTVLLDSWTEGEV